LDGFSFDIARVMLAAGFAPDTIPSHGHALGCIHPITAMAIPQS
jgi:predicted amidohydrolase